METRIRARFNINFKVSCELDEKTQSQFRLSSGNRFEVESLDISELGIGILSKYFLPKGLILAMEIEGKPLGLNEVIRVKAEIRYSKYIKGAGYHCGAKFLNISDKHRKAIAEFISLHERRKEPRVKFSD